MSVLRRCPRHQKHLQVLYCIPGSSVQEPFEINRLHFLLCDRYFCFLQKLFSTMILHTTFVIQQDLAKMPFESFKFQTV